MTTEGGIPIRHYTRLTREELSMTEPEVIQLPADSDKWKPMRSALAEKIREWINDVTKIEQTDLNLSLLLCPVCGRGRYRGGNASLKDFRVWYFDCHAISGMVHQDDDVQIWCDILDQDHLPTGSTYTYTFTD